MRRPMSTTRSDSDKPKKPDVLVAQVVGGIEATPYDPVKWREENKEAFEYWNEYVEINGLPLARYRLF